MPHRMPTSRPREKAGKGGVPLPDRYGPRRVAGPKDDTFAEEHAIVDRLAEMTAKLNDPWAAAVAVFGEPSQEARPPCPPAVPAVPMRNRRRRRWRSRAATGTASGAVSTE